MTSFTHLQAWQIGMTLVKEVYKLTKEFPADERFGITSQIRRASVGILANIAEGFSRVSGADKAYKYAIARGECAEVHALLLICSEIFHIKDEQPKRCIALALHTGQLLSGLVHRFQKKHPQP